MTKCVDSAARRVSNGIRLSFVVCALALGACGDGGGDEDAAANNAPSGQAPTITGAPQTTVMQNTAYVFQPTASDPNGDSLTFSILGLPGWATFNTSTGRLNGTPSSGNVGNYTNIRISVSDGTNTTNLAAFNISVVATASGSATLSWNAPTQNTDGSALTDLAGYRIYWGTSQGSYAYSRTLTGVGLQTAVVEPLTPATWYFVVTAFDSSGNESTYSNVASKTVM